MKFLLLSGLHSFQLRFLKNKLAYSHFPMLYQHLFWSERRRKRKKCQVPSIRQFISHRFIYCCGRIRFRDFLGL